MSGETEANDLTFGRAEQVEAAASDWLARRVTDNWGEADEAALQAWLGEAPAHRIAFLRLEAAWGYTSRLGALRAPRHGYVAEVRMPGRSVLKVAAALVVLALAGGSAASYFSAPREKIYTTAVGGRETLKLADGSQIELNTDTVLRLVYSGKVRKATLERGKRISTSPMTRSAPSQCWRGNTGLPIWARSFWCVRVLTNWKLR